MLAIYKWILISYYLFILDGFRDISYSQFVGDRGPERKESVINNKLTVEFTMH
jgi:hypothetical protein